MFYDLNVKKSSSPNWQALLRDTTERLIKYGYKILAITTEVDEEVFEKHKKEKKKEPIGGESVEVIPPPVDLKELQTKYPNITFYSRINITVSDGNNIRKYLQCQNLKKYDLVSFQPENQNVLKSLSGVPEVDIIAYNPESKSTLTYNRKLYNQFVNQNVYFEIMYGPAVTDSTARRNLLSLSHVYSAVGKSKNTIVTSGALNASHVRGPYDVINFNLLFGLSEEQSKGSISRNCEKLLLRARRQRRNKCVVEMMRIKGKEEKEAEDNQKMEVCEERDKKM